MKVLLTAEANVDITDEFRLTPLHYAATHGHITALVMLLDAKASVDVKDVDYLGKEKGTALHYATEAGYCHAMVALIDANAALNARDYRYMTLLHLSARQGHTKTTELLLYKKAQAYYDGSDLQLCLCSCFGIQQGLHNCMMASSSSQQQRSLMI